MKPEQQHLASSQQSLPWWVRLCRWLWKLIAFLGISVLFALGINTLSTWFTSSKGVIPADSPAGVLLAQWPLTLLVSLCLFLLALMIWLLSRWQIPETRNAQFSVQDRERMLRRLHLRYEQMLAQSLQGVVQLELGLVSRPTAVHNAASLSQRLPDQPEQPLPPHTSIAQAYELAQQELLILGEPGAGKSTLLLELAHHLVEQAEVDTTQPLSIVLPLSSWATKRPVLQEWLVEQVALLYDVPRRLCQQWIQANAVLPLLDGLDEVKEPVRADCIAAINTYHRQHLLPLVICSRTAEYDRATTQERLALHAAVVVQPLSVEQVDAHLEQLGKPLAALRTALRKNVALQELATTPLLLQVLILTYHDTSVQALSQKEDLLRQQVWGNYVQRMINRKGNAKRYSLDVTQRWLSWLARRMCGHHQTVFFLEQIQPDWLPAKKQISYTLLLILVCALLGGLGDALGIVLTRELGMGLASGLFGAMCLQLFLMISAKQTSIKPVEELWLQKKMGRMLSSGLVSGLLFGLLGGLTSGLFFGLGCGLLSGLFFGLNDGLGSIPLAERFLLSPNGGIHRSMRHGMSIALFFGLVGGLFFGLVSEPSFGPGDGLTSGLLGGLLSGLLFGLLGGLFAALQHYTLRFWLWRSGVFPLQAVPFLEDATTRILLRRVGGGYSFTHRLLMDYFADLDTTASTTAPSSPTSIH